MADDTLKDIVTDFLLFVDNEENLRLTDWITRRGEIDPTGDEGLNKLDELLNEWLKSRFEE